MHFGRIIHSPYMNMNAHFMCLLNKSLCDDLNATHTHRHLGRVHSFERHRNSIGSQHQRHDPPAAGSDRQAIAEQCSRMVYSTIAESTDEHTIQGVGFQDGPSQGFDRTVAFGIEVDEGRRKRFEQLADPQNRLSSIDASSADLSPGQLGDITCTVGRAIEPIVVHDHRDPVTGHLHVSFDIAETEIDGMSKSTLRVFWIHAGATAMSKGDRTPMLQERMQVGHGATILPTLVHPQDQRNKVTRSDCPS